jgi:phosphate transport system substrate-binding protein
MLKSLLSLSALTLAVCAHATEWDLSAMPHYAPSQRVAGTIKVGGASMAGLVVIWEKAFQKYQPGVQFVNELPSSDMAMALLASGKVDIAPCGREFALE